MRCFQLTPEVSSPSSLTPPRSVEAFHAELARRYDRWLVAQRYAVQTRYHYGRSVRKFAAFLGDRSVLETTHLDIQEFLASCALSGASPKALRGELYALRVFFDFLNLGGLLKWVPPRMVKLRPLPRLIPKCLTRDQVKKILAATKTAHENALIEVLYGTGCRTGELRTMRIENIDFRERRVVVSGKGNPRTILFTPTAVRALRQYIGKRERGYVFIEQRPPQRIRPQRSNTKGQWFCRWKVYDDRGRHVASRNRFVGAGVGLNYEQAVRHFSEIAKGDRLLRPLGLRPLSDAAIQTTVSKIGYRVGIALNPYSFRHAFASHLLDGGADIRIVQDLLGHASIRSTQVYLHVSKKQVQRVFERCHPRK